MGAETYIRNYSTKTTPQTQRIPGREDQVQNNAGGYGWAVDGWKQLERFLVLGSENGTYYVSERKLTIDNASSITKLIGEDGIRVVDVIHDFSVNNRAPKQNPILFALALCCSPQFAPGNVRSYAYSKMPEIVRTGTHLYTFMAFRKELGGWGSGFRRSVQNWYLNRHDDSLANQLVKYRQRSVNGESWTHRDLLRIAHPKPKTDAQNNLLAFAVGKGPERVHPLVDSFVRIQKAQERGTLTKKDVVREITEYGLPWEALPTEHLGDPEVWEALLPNLPPHALLRNLGRMTANGLIAPMNDATKYVVQRLGDHERMKKARVHPVDALNALLTYSNGGGRLGKLSWSPAPQIKDALDNLYYASFGMIEPTGKRHLLGLDVSGSMSFGTCVGMDIHPAEGTACMSMVTARLEPEYHIMGFAHTFRDLGITAKDTLQDAIAKVQHRNFGGTDCALPMEWALKNRVPVDTFVVYTDSETWAGRGHPSQALQKYRDKMGIPAKLVVVAMVSNRHTIADPQDSGMMDVVGFDSSVPRLLSEFAKQ